jgi:hypothetical protein
MRRENHNFLKNGSKIFAREGLSFRSPLNRHAKLVLGCRPRAMHGAPPITLFRHPTGKSIVVSAALSQRLQANGDEICMSRDVVDAPGVGDLLSRFAISQQDIMLKGIGRPVIVFRAGSSKHGNSSTASA